MFRALIYFSLCFLFLPHFSFAWGGMCHSPVQMAALMSKPPSKKNSLNRIRQDIRAKEKSINSVEKSLNKEEGKLADSLNESALRGETGFDVAREIRDYMESQQDGWDCPEDQSLRGIGLREDLFARAVFKNSYGLSSFFLALWPELREGAAGAFSAPIPPQLFSALAPLFIPPVYGETLVEADDFVAGEKSNKGNDSSNNQPQALSKSQRQIFCERTGGQWGFLSGGPRKACVCPKGNEFKAENGCVPIATSSAVKKCSRMNRVWNNEESKCCPSGQTVVSGKCQNPISNRKKSCEDSGGTWSAPMGEPDKKVCVCPTGQKLLDGQCVPIAKDSVSERKCLVAGRVWNNEKSKCCPSGQKVVSGKCIGPSAYDQALEPCKADHKSAECQRQICARQNRVWNEAKNECCSIRQKVIKGECVKVPIPLSSPGKTEGADSADGDDVETMDIGGADQSPDDEQKRFCKKSDGEWSDSKCECKEDMKFERDRGCVPIAAATAAGDDDPPCPEWKKHKAFGDNGRVQSSFCDKYAQDKGDCKKALKRIKDRLSRLSKLEDAKSDLEDKKSDFEFSSSSDSKEKTEAGGLCFSCLKRVLAASQPTAGETVGNILSMFTGAGMGIVGYNMGKRAQYDANMLRIQQGYEAQHDYYSLAGAQAGFPFLAQGLYGMTRANTPAGGWSCSPTVSPYGHSYNYQYGQGFMMPYY